MPSPPPTAGRDLSPSLPEGTFLAYANGDLPQDGVYLILFIICGPTFRDISGKKGFKNEKICGWKNRHWLSSNCICQKETKMGSIIGHRIDYHGVALLIGHRHISSKNWFQSLPPGCSAVKRSTDCACPAMVEIMVTFKARIFVYLYPYILRFPMLNFCSVFKQWNKKSVWPVKRHGS